tara:strand:- start:1421 stop:2332 length:912 start_codon:yes stop_codon:yes gene_type:complete
MNVLLNGINSFTGIAFSKILLDAGHKIYALSSGQKKSLTSYQKYFLEKLEIHDNFIPIISEYNCSFQKIIQINSNIDVFIIHGFNVANYKDQNINPFKMASDSLFWLSDFPKILKEKGCQLIAYTGTYFENFSAELQTPYSLSKSMGWTYISNLFNEFKLVKYLLPNPFGELESERFTHSLLKSLLTGTDFFLKEPYLIRDNIPVNFVLDFYKENIELEFKKDNINKLIISPSYFKETNLEFAKRVINKVLEIYPSLKYKLIVSDNDYSNKVSGNFSIREKYLDKENIFWANYINLKMEQLKK